MDDLDMLFGILFVIVLIISGISAIIGASKAKRVHKNKKVLITEKERAGIRGEVRAAKIINNVLESGDYLFQNIEIEVDNRPAEFDSVVVNKYGVFIFEVKNYKGTLEGDEDDYEWKKYSVSEAGNTYVKTVKNPIKQVKREIYLMSEYLKRHGVKVWVKGYAMLMNGNSPVFSEHLVTSSRDIDFAVHTSDRKILTQNEVNRIIKLLE